MKIETFEQRVLIPETGHFLYNERENVISEKVYLGKYAVQYDWVEITGEEKQRIEIEQEEQKYEEI